MHGRIQAAAPQPDSSNVFGTESACPSDGLKQTGHALVAATVFG